MIRLNRLIIQLGTVLFLAVVPGCTNEFGANPRPFVCVPPPIGQNILGTWQYVSTFGIENYDVTMPKRRGQLTFRADGTLDDPNELFESELYGRRVIAKTYNPKVNYKSDVYTGYTFEVYQIMSSIRKQTVLFILIKNECDHVQLALFDIQDNAINVKLSR